MTFGAWRNPDHEESQRIVHRALDAGVNVVVPQGESEEIVGEALADEAGVSLVHLAIAFVLRHPGVTSAIIGPRTVEQLESRLGAVDHRTPEDVLARIDEIVPPGTNFSAADAGRRPHPGFEKAGRRPA